MRWPTTQRAASRLAAPVAFALAAFLGTAAVAGATGDRKIVTATKNKGKIAVAVAPVYAPVGRLSTSVVATPAQKVTIDWSLTCETRIVGGGYPPPTRTADGKFETSTPFTRVLPLPAAHPVECSLSVYAILSRTGHETLEILEG